MQAAVCNELIGDRPFAEGCRLIAQQGFQGVEVAPYTLADDPTRIPSSRLQEFRRQIADAGLCCAGLHWLLRAPAGLHLTTPDLATRRRSWECLRALVDLCAGLGGEVMVLGSGKQRDAQGHGREAARAVLVEGLAGLAPIAATASVRVLLEALPSAVTDVVNTLSEAREVIRAVGHPAVSGMFDFHNCRDETVPWDCLIARHRDLIGHVHLNETDGYHPSLAPRVGRARSEYRPAFRALSAGQYAGWISLEIFRAEDPPETILAETRAFLNTLQSCRQQ
jgi:sugar phosphate isomerase/epimerase